jgi:hypothetical protein
MRKVLLISFDLIKAGEPSVTYAIGSLLAALKTSYGYMVDCQMALPPNTYQILI